MKEIIHNDWQQILESEFDQPYYQKLRDFLKREYTSNIVYPDAYHIFQSLEWTPFKNVKVVILGQDPYHGAGQAHGLSFSVKPGVKLPPSLQNIYKELDNDLGIKPVSHGYLKNWAEQGVLMLNTVLTVQDKQPFSHQNQGWEIFTDNIIQKLSKRNDPVIFILWGKAAQSKIKLIDTKNNYVIKSAHPSPFSANRGFFGSAPFSKTNDILVEMNKTPISWKLPNEPRE